MKKLILALSLSLSFVVLAQPITTPSLTLFAPPPPAVKSITTTLVGNAGNATYYYWVVAVFPGGKASASAPAVIINAPNTLSGSAYVRLNWASVPGATGYDVLRTTGPLLPSGAATIALATATTATTLNDQGGALSSYTVTTQGGTATTCVIDNITVTPPTVTCSPIAWSGVGTGDVVGPASSVTNTIALFADNTGKLLGEATGCLYASTNGGQESCAGGFVAGDGTGTSLLDLLELAASGNDSARVIGAGTQSVSTCMQLPLQPGDVGQSLKDSGTTVVDTTGRTCRVLVWVSVPSEYFQWGLCIGAPCTVAANLTAYAIVSNAETLNKCYAAAKTGPTGASLIIDILKAGVSIFGGGTKLVIADGATTGSQATIANASIAENDNLTISITQIGSGTAGQDVSVKCKATM